MFQIPTTGMLPQFRDAVHGGLSVGIYDLRSESAVFIEKGGETT
jgi:hypothetical protein